jgi:hypothetical protein
VHGRLGAEVKGASGQALLGAGLVFVVAVAYESLFIGHGLNPIDEAWPLWAVHQMKQGGTLYEHVLWVFPPGHLLSAWVAQSIDPPGFRIARTLYAAFAVALSVSCWFLARRLMAPIFALAASLCIALAAPNTHLMHAIFGYRYMVFSILALLAFDRRLTSNERRWLFVTGLLLGVGGFFRLGPAFAAGCGIGFAIMVAHRSPRDWLRDWVWLAAGLGVVFAPLLLWCAATVGLPTLWTEIVTRPATMLVLQSLELPPMEWPDGFDRVDIRVLFVALQFRLIWVLYGLYLVGLAVSYVRARQRGEAFPHALLMAVWLFGGVFFVRSLTRSDELHLDSVIPPVCLLTVHWAYLACQSVGRRFEIEEAARGRAHAAVAALLVASWVFLLGVDLWVPHARRGEHEVVSMREGIEVQQDHQAQLTDRIVRRLRLTDPEARILDLTASPVYKLLADRRGYGANDLVMPGTFLDDAEARDFFERVKKDPPQLVIWPKHPYDKLPARAVERTAPELTAWVQEHYVKWGLVRRHYLMGPRGTWPPEGW